MQLPEEQYWHLPSRPLLLLWIQPHRKPGHRTMPRTIVYYVRMILLCLVSLRIYCKLFSKALKPVPYWTSFPHPKYSTLNKLFGRFDEVSSSGSTNVPKVLLIENGEHTIEYGEDCNVVTFIIL